MARTERQRAFIVAVRHGANGTFRNADDCRQDHNAEQNGRCQHRVARHAENVLYKRHQNNETEEAVHNGRHTRHQLRCRFQNFIKTLRAELCEENCRQKPDRHTDDDCARRDVEAAEDHRQNTVDVVARLPLSAEQEFKHADFTDGRNTVCKQKHADQNNGKDRYAGCEKKEDMHEKLFYVAPLHGLHAPFKLSKLLKTALLAFLRKEPDLSARLSCVLWIVSYCSSDQSVVSPV